MPDFFFYALFCGLGVALVSGPLGAFVVWRRMAYFGDTLAHSALLGAAIGVILQIQPLLAVLVSSVLLAIALSGLQSKTPLANDTVLGILSHSTLALGLVCASMISHTRIDLWAILFGDLLTSTQADMWLIFLVSGITLGLLALFWSKLILATLDEKLAKVEGIATEGLRMLLMVLIAVVVALAMKVVGVLLITALLVIPAATSRQFSRSPEAMAIGAAIVGMAAVCVGLSISFYVDSPAGPTIVLTTSVFFMVALLLNQRSNG